MAQCYVAQDEGGGWYADCLGVMQNSDPSRTREQALEWALARLTSQRGYGGDLHYHCRLIDHERDAYRIVLEMVQTELAEPFAALVSAVLERYDIQAEVHDLR